MKTITLTNISNNNTFNITAGKIYVGRAQENELVLSSNLVSRRHARLDRDGDHVWVTDLGSMNGTFVNNSKLAPNVKRPLIEGDEICFGQTEKYIIKGCDRFADSSDTVLNVGNQRAKAKPRFGFA